MNAISPIAASGLDEAFDRFRQLVTGPATDEATRYSAALQAALRQAQAALDAAANQFAHKLALINTATMWTPARMARLARDWPDGVSLDGICDGLNALPGLKLPRDRIAIQAGLMRLRRPGSRFAAAVDAKPRRHETRAPATPAAPPVAPPIAADEPKAPADWCTVVAWAAANRVMLPPGLNRRQTLAVVNHARRSGRFPLPAFAVDGRHLVGR